MGLVISTQAPDDEHPLSQLIDDGLAAATTGRSTCNCWRRPKTPTRLPSAPGERAIRHWASSCRSTRCATPPSGRRRIPAFEPAFRNLRLNQRIDAREDERARDACGLENSERCRSTASGCGGGSAMPALDLSGKHDLTALVLAFPTTIPSRASISCRFSGRRMGDWRRRQAGRAERFREWIGQGFMTSVPGPTVRFGYVAQALVELSREFEIQVLGYDRWRIDDFKADLDRG